MARECLNTVTASNVPKLCGSIAGSRNKRLLVWGEGQRHDVPCVACEGGHLLPRLDVPKNTGHVPAGGEDLIVVQESAAAEIARVPGQLSGNTNCPIAVFQVVY